eukprot:Clim_evm4s82 gene=Clim_evmTU4s82
MSDKQHPDEHDEFQSNNLSEFAMPGMVGESGRSKKGSTKTTSREDMAGSLSQAMAAHKISDGGVPKKSGSAKAKKLTGQIAVDVSSSGPESSDEENDVDEDEDEELVLETFTGDTEEARMLREGQLEYINFTKLPTCYDLIPLSGKVVVFDTSLLVKKAFFALVQNGIRSAPLWSSKYQKFVGMITITDFVNILRHYYQSPLVKMDELEEHKISTWRQTERNFGEVRGFMIHIDPTASLYDAVKTLIKHKIHRLPVIEPSTGSVIAVLTHKRILHFIHANVKVQPRMLQISIEELNLGTYNNIVTVTRDTPIIVALKMFADKRISALPVVDEEGRVVDVYAKFDVINLARERSYNDLDRTIREALAHRQEGFEGVHTCLRTDSLGKIMNQIVKARVHRLVIVDEEQRVSGVISLSDILSFLLGVSNKKYGKKTATPGSAEKEADKRMYGRRQSERRSSESKDPTTPRRKARTQSGSQTQREPISRSLSHQVP